MSFPGCCSLCVSVCSSELVSIKNSSLQTGAYGAHYAQHRIGGGEPTRPRSPEGVLVWVLLGIAHGVHMHSELEKGLDVITNTQWYT